MTIIVPDTSVWTSVVYRGLNREISAEVSKHALRGIIRRQQHQQQRNTS